MKKENQMKTSRRSFMGGVVAAAGALASGFVAKRVAAAPHEHVLVHATPEGKELRPYHEGDLSMGSRFPPDPEDGQVWELTVPYLDYSENTVWRFDGAFQGWTPISHNRVPPLKFQL